MTALCRIDVAQSSETERSIVPNGNTNAGISNLSTHVLRQAHRQAKLLTIRTGLPLPVVISWWLAKLPESVSASEYVEMLVTNVQMTALRGSDPERETATDEPEEPLEENQPSEVQELIEEEIRQTCESMQLSERELDLAAEAAANVDRPADEDELDL
jgi:hypothetical protein